MKKKLMIFCIAVVLSLTLAVPSFAALTLDLDGSELAVGTYSGTAGTITPPYPISGDIIFVGEIYGGADIDFPSGTGNSFDVIDWNGDWASLTFDFDPKFAVTDVSFIYGGNKNTIEIEAWSKNTAASGDPSNAVLLDSLTADTDNGDPIGPATLEAGSGNSIYTLRWRDPDKLNLAQLDNISLTVIPAPGAILLGSIGAGLVGWLRRRRTL